MFPFILLIRSHIPPSITQQCLSNALWSIQNQCPAPLMMCLFISLFSHLYLCMIMFCVLSLFYDPKYHPHHHYAGLWSCRRLGLNSFQHASVFHVPYRSAMSYRHWYCCKNNGESMYSWQLIALLCDVIYLPLHLDIWGNGGSSLYKPLTLQPFLQDSVE